MVPGTWKRGHWARGENSHLQPLPGPNDDVPDDDEDLPEELQAEIDQLDWLDSQRPEAEPMGPPPEDPPPARLRGPRQSAPPPRRGRAPSATVQKDVRAKIRMILQPAGKVWSIRDGICGPVFVEQEPEISEALAEIVCDSPDLLNWFTGPAGGYMKYFKLFMAVQPVLLVLWMHHVAHAGEGRGVDGQQPPAPAFAA